MMANTWFAKSALNSRAGCNTGHICLQFSHGILCLYCNPIFGSWFTTGNRVLGIKMLNQKFEREREEWWAIVCLWPISILTLLLSHCGYIYRYVTARGVNLEQNIMKSKHTLTSIETILIFPQKTFRCQRFPKASIIPMKSNLSETQATASEGGTFFHIRRTRTQKDLSSLGASYWDLGLPSPYPPHPTPTPTPYPQDTRNSISRISATPAQASTR